MSIIFVVFMLLISLLSFGLLIWALVDIAKSEFEGQMKLVWILVVLLGGLIGIIVYLAVGRSQKIPPGGNATSGDPFSGK